LREILAYAEGHGLEVIDEYHEAASAFQKESKRVEFHRMLESAKARPEVGAVLVHDFSRFSRDSIRAKTLMRDLRQQGVRVVSVNDAPFDTETVAGVYMEAITFAKNEAFSREVAFHTRKGCRSSVQTRDAETGWCYKNGGQPLFGYKSVQFQRGEEKKGRPITKSIWLPDDTVVNGRPMHEWARECLLMAAKGTSLDELRDYWNSNGIPARRNQYWGQGTWNSLLQPAC
jgi:DNA invertase Pin-like site-specific DNA recombinase